MLLFSKCVLIVKFFSPLHSIDFTEELLEAHEAEAAKVGVIMLLDVHLEFLINYIMKSFPDCILFSYLSFR